MNSAIFLFVLLHPEFWKINKILKMVQDRM